MPICGLVVRRQPAENLLQTTCLRCLEAADHEAGVEAGGD